MSVVECVWCGEQSEAHDREDSSWENSDWNYVCDYCIEEIEHEDSGL